MSPTSKRLFRAISHRAVAYRNSSQFKAVADTADLISHGNKKLGLAVIYALCYGTWAAWEAKEHLNYLRYEEARDARDQELLAKLEAEGYWTRFEDWIPF